MTDDFSLFDMLESDPTKVFDKYIRKYEPEPITKQERLRRMARRSDPQTSHIAAQKTLPKLTQTKQKILDLLSNHPQGLTSSEVAHLLNIDKGSSSKRLGDLEKEGYIHVCGTRPSDRGRPSSVYQK